MLPELKARDLNGVERQIPTDFNGDPTLVIFAFRIDHQEDVETWLPHFMDVPLIEVPLLNAREKWMATFIEGGMRRGVRDLDARARTWTAYTDLDAFRIDSKPVDKQDIVVVAARPNGEVLAQATGPATPEGINVIRSAFVRSVEI